MDVLDSHITLLEKKVDISLEGPKVVEVLLDSGTTVEVTIMGTGAASIPKRAEDARDAAIVAQTAAEQALATAVSVIDAQKTISLAALVNQETTSLGVLTTQENAIIQANQVAALNEDNREAAEDLRI